MPPKTKPVQSVIRVVTVLALIAQSVGCAGNRPAYRIADPNRPTTEALGLSPLNPEPRLPDRGGDPVEAASTGRRPADVATVKRRIKLRHRALDVEEGAKNVAKFAGAAALVTLFVAVIGALWYWEHTNDD